MSALGAFKTVLIGSWPALLMTAVGLHTNLHWDTIVKDVRVLCGTTGNSTLIRYRRLIQESLKAYLETKKLLKVGGADTVGVIDETSIGVYTGVGPHKFVRGMPSGRSRPGASVAAQANGERNRSKHIAKKLPARTIWKTTKKCVKRSGVLKKKPAKSPLQTDDQTACGFG